jgi:AcrR family transcriptional regulator
MVTRAEMAVRTRARLVSAAVALFAEQPYDRTSVGDIAAAAGVTKGAFYHHYAGKEELLRSIQRQLLDEMIDSSAAIVARGLPPCEELRELVRLHLTVVIEHREVLSISVPERRSVGPADWAVIKAKRDRIEAFVVDAIVRGSALGVFTAPGDPRLLAYGLLGMCYWSNVWFRRDGRWSFDEVVDRLADLALGGLNGTPVSGVSV